MQGLERGRGGAEHDRHARVPGPHHRQVAGGIVEAALVLLVGGIVLLVDDDEPEIGHGREHHRAGAEHDAGAAA